MTQPDATRRVSPLLGRALRTPAGVVVHCAEAGTVPPAGTPHPSETQRLAAFVAEPAARGFRAGRDLARALVAQRAGVLVHDVVLLGECPRCGLGGHGRPGALRRESPAAGGTGLGGPAPGGVGEELASLSLSRASGWIAVAVGPAGTRLGLDLVDVTDPAFDPTLPGCVGAPRDWARAEALGKLAGTGIVGETTSDGPHGAGPGRAAPWQGYGRVPGAPRRSPLRAYLAVEPDSPRGFCSL